MRGYLAEFLGTFFLVFTFLSAAASTNPLAPVSVAAVLVATAWTGAHISGAHYNPAVSLGAYLHKRLALTDLLFYWASQLLGALFASSLGMWVFTLPHGGRDVVAQGSLWPALVVEFMFTFALVYVVLSLGAVRQQTDSIVYGAAIGFVVLAGMLTVEPISGAAFNPAIAFGMGIAGEFSWSAIWVYLVAHVAAGAVAAPFAARVVRP